MIGFLQWTAIHAAVLLGHKKRRARNGYVCASGARASRVYCNFRNCGVSLMRNGLGLDGVQGRMEFVQAEVVLFLQFKQGVLIDFIWIEDNQFFDLVLYNQLIELMDGS